MILAILGWLGGIPNASATAGTLEQIAQTGKIRIGYRKAQPPMSFLNQAGKPVGYTIDICTRIVAGIKNKLGKEFKTEYVPVTADDRFSALTENKIDILCGSTTKTLSRAKLVDFTQLTFVTGASLMTLKEKGIHNLAALNGMKIGVVRDTNLGTLFSSGLSAYFGESLDKHVREGPGLVFLVRLRRHVEGLSCGLLD